MLTDIPVIEGTEADFTLGEFFIMYKYRREGVGKRVFFEVMDRHKGRVQLVRHPNNVVAVSFWNNVVREYTSGKYELVESHIKWVYSDGTLRDVFFFET